MSGKASMNLKFGENGKFKIMAIGDCHEKVSINEKTEDFLRLINKSLDELKPDFAIFLGDIVSGNNHPANRTATTDELFEAIKRITEPLTSRNISFGLTFGNHDGQSGENKEVLFELFSRIPGFVNTNETGVTGVGNCYVPIYDRNGQKQLFNIWLIDSGDKSQDGTKGYAWVDDDQIAWYEKTCRELKENNGGKVIPSFVFQHIPVCEEYLLLKETTILNPYRVRGHGSLSDRFYVKGDNCTGYLGEGPCVPSKNNGQFSSWKMQGDVIGAFFGHDHMNDFIGTVEGIVLGQSKSTGFQMYGDGLHQGVRMITLHESCPERFETTMHYYRDFFGTECNSIKGYDLLTDRWHTNFKATLYVLGGAAALAVVGVGTKKIVKFLKK